MGRGNEASKGGGKVWDGCGYRGARRGKRRRGGWGERYTKIEIEMIKLRWFLLLACLSFD